MTPDEALEFAARVAPDSQRTGWNPLLDDGEALRLVMDLRMSLHFEAQPDGSDLVEVHHSHKGDSCQCVTHLDTGPASVRWAIVRAAADIGKKRHG